MFLVEGEMELRMQRYLCVAMEMPLMCDLYPKSTHSSR